MQGAPKHGSPGWTPRGFVTARGDLAGSPTGHPGGGFVTARNDEAGSPSAQPSSATLVPTRASFAGRHFTCATNPLFG